MSLLCTNSIYFTTSIIRTTSMSCFFGIENFTTLFWTKSCVLCTDHFFQYAVLFQHSISIFSSRNIESKQCLLLSKSTHFIFISVGIVSWEYLSVVFLLSCSIVPSKTKQMLQFYFKKSLYKICAVPSLLWYPHTKGLG